MCMCGRVHFLHTFIQQHHTCMELAEDHWVGGGGVGYIVAILLANVTPRELRHEPCVIYDTCPYTGT